MKKLAVLLLILLFPYLIHAEGLSKGAWVVLGADAVLSTAAVLAIMQQNTLASDYEKLRAKIDGTSEAGYYRLLYEKEKVESAGNIAMIAGCAAGAVLAFTVVDIFFTHHAFREFASVEVKPLAGGTQLGLLKKF